MANEFLGPYETQKVIEGVIAALPKVRSTFLQDALLPGYVTRNTRSINLDEEFAIKNTSAMFALPKADVTPIQLGDFGTKELYFAYAKEGWSDNDDLETLEQRQLGDQLGQTDVLANKARRLIEKASIAEVRFENLFEKVSASLILYGGYEAFSEKHPKVRYDFGRNVTSTIAQLNATGSLVSSVNLTTAAVTAPWDAGTTILPVIPTSGGFTAGDRAWTNANITAGKATPVKDLVKVDETSKRWGATPKYILMSDDAYNGFAFDVVTNYSKNADNTIRTIIVNPLDNQARPQNIDGLTYRRSWELDNGNLIPIYTLNAKINNRDTGAEEAFIGNGWMLAIPDNSYGLKVYGRIKHPKAGYQAMPRFINRWMEEKTGVEEFEMHSNFLIAHKKINALIAWKVL